MTDLSIVFLCAAAIIVSWQWLRCKHFWTTVEQRNIRTHEGGTWGIAVYQRCEKCGTIIRRTLT